jgi:hypothetical protein
MISGQLHAPATLLLSKEGFVGPRAGLDDVEKRKVMTVSGLILRPLGGPARSQSLYRLHWMRSYLQPSTPIASQ